MLIQNIMGIKTLCSISIKRLYESCLGNYFFKCSPKVLEIMECAEVKKHQDGDDFAIGHLQRTISAPFAIAGLDLEIIELFGEFPAEIVHNTEIPVILSGVNMLILFCYLVDIHLQR
ncbi:MAG: hypothetical protein LBK65_00630 [Tannerellaceae bacterium]|jgi:hypothetical protein|nr:hypothetical protein [Tannerellaceae bacterium]